MLSYHSIALSLGICLLSTGVRAADVVPTIDEVRQLSSGEKYADVVRTVSKIVHAHEWQAKKPDAYELYTLKAEAHLHMKESALAISTFDMAAKAAADDIAADKTAMEKNGTAKDDPLPAKLIADQAHAGTARATAYLLRHCIGANYVSKPTGDKPEDHVKIDILNPETRKQALTAIWTDAKNASAPAFAAAAAPENKSVQALLITMPALAPLRDLDFAAHGNDSDTRQIAAQIAERARDLIQETLDPMVTKVDNIRTDAMEVSWSRQGSGNGNGYTEKWRKHGLEGKQPAELQEMYTKSTKIAATLKQFMDGLPIEKDYFTKPDRGVKHIHETAEKLLKTNYSLTYPTKEAAME